MLIMLTCLFRGKRVTACAMEYFVEQFHFYAKLFWWIFVKEGMAGIFFIIIADTRMVPTYDSMCTAVIFHDECMQNGFPRACKNISDPESGKTRTVQRVIGFENHPL